MVKEFSYARPKEACEEAHRIYDVRYRAEFEAKHMGTVVAVNVKTGNIFLPTETKEALLVGNETEPGGIFVGLRVGSPTVYTHSWRVGDVHVAR